MTKDNLKKICHMFAGLIIIILAFDFFEHNILNLSILYIAAGGVFLVVTGLSNWLQKSIGKFSNLVFFAEGAAFYYAAANPHTAFDMMVTGVLKLAALTYVILGLVFMFSADANAKKHRSKKRRRRTRSSSGSGIDTGSSLN